MGRQLSNLILIAVLAGGLLNGCSKNSGDPRNGDAKQDVYLCDYQPYQRGTNSVELPANRIRITGEEIPPDEKDLAEALGLRVWKFKLVLPENADALWISVDLNKDGKRLHRLIGASVDSLSFNHSSPVGPVSTAGKIVPIYLAVNPVGNMQGEGILDSPKLRFYLKTSYFSSQNTVPNPFYHATNMVSESGMGRSLFTDYHESRTNQEVNINFQLFVGADTNKP